MRNEFRVRAIRFSLSADSNSRVGCLESFSSVCSFANGAYQKGSHESCEKGREFKPLQDQFEFLPYQLSIVAYGPTMTLTGNGESGFYSGEGA